MQKPGYAAFAIGTGNPHHRHVRGGLAVKTCSNDTDALSQSWQCQYRCRLLLAQGDLVTLLDHQSCSGVDGRTDKASPVGLLARQCKEQIAGRDLAAVQRQPGNLHSGKLCRQCLIRQQGRKLDAHERPPRSARLAQVPSAASGRACSMRMTPDTTLENTGAATWPP